MSIDNLIDPGGIKAQLLAGMSGVGFMINLRRPRTAAAPPSVNLHQRKCLRTGDAREHRQHCKGLTDNDAVVSTRGAQTAANLPDDTRGLSGGDKKLGQSRKFASIISVSRVSLR